MTKLDSTAGLCPKAILCFRLLFAVLSQRKPGIEHMLAYVGFLVDKVALRHVYFEVFMLYPNSIIP